MNLVEELKAVVSSFEREKIDYALCGGLAMAVYGLPRATLDIDLMLQVASLSSAEQVLRSLGFTLKSSPMSFKEGKVQIFRMTKPFPASGEHLMIDLLIVTPETYPAWESRTAIEWQDGPLKVLSPGGLIELKSLRMSGTDKDDIAHLREILNED